MLTPDWWDSPRFQTFSLAQARSAKVAFSHPAHQRVTPAVSPHQTKHLGMVSFTYLHFVLREFQWYAIHYELAL